MKCKHCGEPTPPPGGWFQWMEHDAICEKKPQPPEPIGGAEWCDWLEDQLKKAELKKDRSGAFEAAFFLKGRRRNIITAHKKKDET